MIKKSLDVDVKFLLKSLLKIKPHERPTIDQVLKYEAFTKNLD